MEIRGLRPHETPFLEEMLYTALAWRPDAELPPRVWVLEQPQAAPFHTAWGRAGDTGLVAEEDGVPCGLAWYRSFTDDEHGEGLVDEATPEVAVAVVDGMRGRGIGGVSMVAIQDRARENGCRAHFPERRPDNPAKRLYARLGYVDLEPDDENGRMILELA